MAESPRGAIGFGVGSARVAIGVRRDVILALVIVLVSTSFVRGRPRLEERPDQPWRVADLTNDAGLRGRFVMQAAVDPEGTVWLATADGLRAGDGWTWRWYRTADGLPSDFVRSVHVHDGELWVGTDRGVVVRRDGRFVPIVGDDVVTNVRRIRSSSDGSVWLCGDRWRRLEARVGISRYHDGAWTRYTTADGLPTDYVHDLAEDSQGNVFALTQAGPAMLRDGGWHAVPGWPGGAAPVWSAIEAPNGDLMIGVDHGIFLRRGDTWRSVLSLEPQQEFAKSLCRVGDEVIAVTIDGLDLSFVRWNGSGFEPAGAAWSRLGQVESVAPDGDGGVWCVGMNVVARWRRRGARWVAYTAPPGASLTLDPEGRAWLSSENGALILEDDRASPRHEVRGQVSFADPSAIWSWQAGRVVRHGTAGVMSAAPERTGLAIINRHLTDAQGRSWFRGRDRAGRPALTVYADGRWHPRSDLGPPGWVPTGWAADRTDGVWLVGLVSRSNRVRVLHLEFPAEVTSYVLDDMASVTGPRVFIDTDNTGWILGEFGLHWHNGNGWTKVDGLPGETIGAVHEAGGVMWVVSSGVTGGRSGISWRRDGVWRHLETDAQRFVGRCADGSPLFAGGTELCIARGSAAWPVRCQHVPTSDAIGSAVEDAAGDLWVVAGETLLRYRGDGVPPDTLVGAPAAELIAAEPFAITVTATERFRPRADSRFEYSWRLDEGAWSVFSTTSLETLVAPRESGAYRLQVRARDEDGDIDPTPGEVAIDVYPVSLYDRAWFAPTLAGVILTILALVGLLIMSRIRIRRYASRLEVLVARETMSARLSDARLKTALDNIPSLVFETDARGATTFVNDRWVPMTGWPVEAAQGDGWAKVLHRDDRDRVFSAWRHAVAAEGEFEQVFRFVGPDGTVTWVIARAVPVRDAEGPVQRYFGVATDFTDRKQMEDRQRRMMNELDHRVKNNLSSLLALLTITQQSTATTEDFVETLAGRIQSMATAHATLAQSKWDDVPLRRLLLDTVRHVDGAEPRLDLRGPDVRLTAASAGPFSLAVHELVTNTAKHGALRTVAGGIDVRWHQEPVDGLLVIDWRERRVLKAGPLVPGAGLGLVRGLIEHDLAGSVTFVLDEGGFRCRIELPPTVTETATMPTSRSSGSGSVTHARMRKH